MYYFPNSNTEDGVDEDELHDTIPELRSGEYTKIRFINQGAFGCVFKPEILCNGEVGNPYYISKIQFDKINIQNEITISNSIKQIPHYLAHMSPILETCSASLSAIPDSEQSKCDVLTEYKTQLLNIADTPKVLSTKMRFAGKYNIENYFTKLPPTLFIYTKKLYSTYDYLLGSLQKLIDKGIVHFDIKEPNIMYDEHNQSPILIDFGISFDTNNVTPDKYSTIFYTKQFYPYWCIDIHILSYITKVITISQYETTTITSQELNQVLDTFINNFNNFLKKYAVQIEETEIAAFRQKIYTYFAKFDGKTWRTLFDTLYQPSIYSTWDNYSLAIVYLIISKTLFIDEATNNTIKSFIELWKSQIFTLPTQRLTPIKTAEVLHQIPIVI